MNRRIAKRATAEGLCLHLLSGERIRLRRFEGSRILASPVILGYWCVMGIGLTMADPSGQAGTTPLDIRVPQYAVGMGVAWLCFFLTFTLGDIFLGGRGRTVHFYDWPLVVATSLIGLSASELTVWLLTDQIRISAKVFAVLAVFYFVVIEINLQFLNWLLLPGMLTRMRTTPETAESPPPTAPQSVLHAGGHRIDTDLIQHIEARGNYVAIHTDTGEYEVPGPFSSLIDPLPGTLGLRIHRSHWVARRAVIAHQRKGRELVLTLAYGGSATVAMPRHGEVIDWLARTDPRAASGQPRPADAAMQG